MVVLDQPSNFIHYPVSPLEDLGDGLDMDALAFILANLASIGYGVVTDYAVSNKTPMAEKLINSGTIAASALAITFSFKLAINPDTSRNPIWRLLGGFFTYVNTVVALRAGFDLFRETHRLPTFHKFAREILAI